MEVAIKPAPQDVFEAYTLFSGSRGNSVYIRSGDTSILIDAGKTLKLTEQALLSIGAKFCDISAIFITHEHSDHIRGLEVMTRRYSPEVHVTAPSAPYIKCGSDDARNRVFVHNPIYRYFLGNMEISSFVTPHDSAMSVGYIVATDEHKLGVVTDLGYMTDDIICKLAECDSVVIESNHDVDMLMCGAYPQRLKRRILSKRGHLSNDECACCVVDLAAGGVRNVLLAHLSGENNRPELAFCTSADEMERRNIHRTSLNVADRDKPTRIC